MTQSLEQAILDILCKRYNRRYVGFLKVKPLKTVGFDVQLGFCNEDKPIHIVAELEWEDFLKYFEKEIAQRKLHHTHYYTGYQTFRGERQYPIDKTGTT